MDEEYKFLTPLIFACENGSINIVKLLLDKKDIDLTIIKGLPSRCFTYDDYTNIARLNINDTPRMQNALLTAILCGEEEIAIMLINHKNMTKEMLFDPRVFYFSCVKCLIKIVKILLNKGVDPNVVAILGGHTSFEGTQYDKKLAINCVINLLSDKYRAHAFRRRHRIDSSYLRDRCGCSARDAKKLFKFLVNYEKIDLNCDDGNYTPLITAIYCLEPRKKNVNIIQRLIDNGADVDKGIGKSYELMVCCVFFFCFVFVFVSFCFVLFCFVSCD